MPDRRDLARELPAVAAHASALAVGAWLLWSTPEPDAPGGRHATEGERTVAVVIPARDEADRLAGLLASLASQTLPPDEVVVVDDHSSDATADIASSFGAVVIAAPSLPPGWLGKPWACHAGAGATTSELMLFLDADVVLAPHALARLAAEHARHRGLVSVQPRHHARRPYEQLSAVCNVVTLMGTGGFSGRPRLPLAMAFGPCLLIGRRDYERAGGHAHPEVRGQVCEDAAMARRARAVGVPVRACAGGAVVGFRMYPGGVRQLVEGWSKMLAGGGRRAPAIPAALTAVWVGGALLGAGRGARAARSVVTGQRRRGGAGLLTDAGVYLAWVAEMRWLFARVGRWNPATAWLFPAPLVTFVALCGRSAHLAATGRPARWRGRPVPAR